MGLAENDELVLTSYLDGLRESYAAIHEQYKTHTIPAWATVNAQRDLLFGSVQSNLKRELSPDGWAAFAKYVHSCKARIFTVLEGAKQ
jgi:hypothetical protein